MSQTPDPHDGARPEFLEQGGGRPLDREPSSRRRKVLVPVLAGLGLAAGGGAAFGAWWFFDEGGQAAEAFPASSVGYVAVTLDPSGSQKLEALRTLEKFPYLADRLDLDGDLGDIDLRERIADALIEEADCDGLDYDDDIEPWLGERAGVAAVALGDDDAIQPLIAVEVRDADAAAEGIEAVTACAGEQDTTAYAVQDGWMLLAETDEYLQQAQGLIEDEGTLADDEDFQRWSGEIDAGLLTLYAAPAAGELVVEDWDEISGVDPAFGAAATEVPEDVATAAEQFEGALAQVRFDDGGLEMEVVGSIGESDLLTYFDGDAGSLAAGLPEDTALVYGYGLGEGWVDWLAELVESDPTTGMQPGDMEQAMQETLGLGLQDLEDALGDVLALAVGDVDVDALVEGDLDSLPAALVTDGDEEAVRELVDAMTPMLGPDAGLLGVTAGDDVVAVGPSSSWGEEIADGGSLGESERFGDVVPEAEGSVALLYADLDVVAETIIGFVEALEEAFSAGFGELPGAEAPEADDAELDELRDNLEPLAALGSSSWIDDDFVVHGLLRVSTD